MVTMVTVHYIVRGKLSLYPFFFFCFIVDLAALQVNRVSLVVYPVMCFFFLIYTSVRDMGGDFKSVRLYPVALRFFLLLRV